MSTETTLGRLLDEAKVLADDRPFEVGHLTDWSLDAEDMIRRLVKAFNEQPAQPQQEPVAEPTAEMLAVFKEAFKGGSIWTDRVTFALSEVFRTSKLYTRPEAREPLTDEQFAAEWRRRVDEVAHGIKGNA